MQITAEEEFLLNQYLNGKPQAVQAIAERFGPSAYGFAFCALAGDSKQAQRFILGAFAGVLRRLSPLDEKQPSFLEQILAGLCEQIKNERTPPGEIVPDDFSGPAIMDSHKRRFRVILKALAELSPRERCLLLLRDQMSFTYEEISQILKINREDIKHILASTRALFHQTIEKRMTKGNAL